MNQTSIDVNNSIERIIKKAKESLGIIANDEIDKDNIYTSWMRSKMLQYKLIEKADDGNYYVLTERGWQFESFTIENESVAINKRKLAIDLKNAERIYDSYWITRVFAWFGAISGLVLLILKLVEWYSK